MPGLGMFWVSGHTCWTFAGSLVSDIFYTNINAITFILCITLNTIVSMLNIISTLTGSQ